MNRPPKKNKQHKDGLLRDPRFDQEVLERAKGAKNSAASDDRNLVSIDEAMSSADFADRLWLFWDRKKKEIGIAALVVAAAVVCYFGVGYLREHGLKAMQAEYLEAQGDSAALEHFAANYASKPLGGVAYLTLADEAYLAGDFEKAAGFYASAQQGVTATALLGRALLGEAMSLQKAGKTDDARKRLAQLVENTSVLGALRGQAAFDLILIEIGAKQTDAATAWLKRIGEIPGAETWAGQAQSYAAQNGINL